MRIPRLLVVYNEPYTLPLHFASTHLTTAVDSVDDLGTQLEVNLAFIANLLLLAHVLVENDSQFFAIDNRFGLYFEDVPPIVES
jgi:hypothetical protein